MIFEKGQWVKISGFKGDRSIGKCQADVLEEDKQVTVIVQGLARTYARDRIKPLTTKVYAGEGRRRKTVILKDREDEE